MTIEASVYGNNNNTKDRHQSSSTPFLCPNRAEVELLSIEISKLRETIKNDNQSTSKEDTMATYQSDPHMHVQYTVKELVDAQNETIRQHQQTVTTHMMTHFQQQDQILNTNINNAVDRLSGTLDSKLDTQNSKIDTQTRWIIGIIFTVLLGFASSIGIGYVSLLPYIASNGSTQVTIKTE